MKILIFNKIHLLKMFSIIFLLFLVISLIYFIPNKSQVLNVISPINISKNKEYDLTGDGKKDYIQIIDSQNTIDLSVNSNDSIFYLSNLLDDKILFNSNKYFKPQIFLNDISRDNIPEIIVQGPKNNKSRTYLFNWNKNSFNLIFSSENNIFGILDSSNSRTPTCYSMSSSEGYSTLNTFMLVNATFLDTNKEISTLPSTDSVLPFIDLVQLPYILDNLPDIFTSSISKEDLSLFWNLDKENYSYSFQNGFFYDYKWSESEDPISIRWRLSFEKTNLRGNENDKEEFILLIDLEKDASSYKINRIQKVT